MRIKNDITTAEKFIPAKIDDASLKKAASACTACPLYKTGTRTVFGEGPKHSMILIVGEQPGHDEDLSGKPFVGPAGRLLEKALEEVGLSRAEVYLTNAVKHFKWHAQGARRIHEKPNRAEIKACLPWLKAELGLRKPLILVCLGVTASEAVLERKVVLKKERGHFFPTSWAPNTFVTVHPSSLLRIPDAADRHRAYADFVADLAKVAARKIALERSGKRAA